MALHGGPIASINPPGSAQTKRKHSRGHEFHVPGLGWVSKERFDAAMHPASPGGGAPAGGGGGGGGGAATSLARRRAMEDKNPLYNPASPLSGHSLIEGARTLSGLDVNPQLQAIDRASSSAQTQGQAVIDRAGGYYHDLAGKAADAVAREQALAGELGTNLKGIGDQAQATTQQAGDEQAQRQAADAAVRGGGLGGGADEQLAAERAAESSRAATDAGAFKSAGALQGSNYSSLANMGSIGTAQRGTEQLGQLSTGLANSLAKLRSQRQDVASSRGAETVKQLLGLRQGEFNNLATGAGLQLKASDIAQQAAQARSVARLGEAKLTEQAKRDHLAHLDRRYQAALAHGDRAGALALKREISDYQKAHGLGPFKPGSSGSGGKGGGKNEAQGAVKTRANIFNAISLLNQGHSPKYLTQQGVSPIVLQAAQDVHQTGKLEPDTVHMLRSLGVHVPSEWLPERSHIPKKKV
jgi:hypothetical protein